MPAPAWEDLSVFLSTDEFATTATITPPAPGEPYEVVGIFDDPYLNAEIGEFDLDTNQPRFLCRETDVANVRKGDSITVSGRNFKALGGAQSDGTGMATIKLAEQ